MTLHVHPGSRRLHRPTCGRGPGRPATLDELRGYITATCCKPTKQQHTAALAAALAAEAPTSSTRRPAVLYWLAADETRGIPARLHTASCGRKDRAGTAGIPATTMAMLEAEPAKCCTPSLRARTLARQAVAIPAVTAAEPGRGELAGGDVQPLPRTARPRVRRPNRHDQRDQDGPRDNRDAALRATS